MTAARIGLLLAAAGDSTRMGFHKALMPIFGRPAVYFMAHLLSSIRFHRRVVTLPLALLLERQVRDELSSYNMSSRANRHPSSGYAGSIRTMLEEHGDELDGVMITPIDSPIFSRVLVLAMLSLARQTASQTIIVPHCNGFFGHPVYLSKHFFFELRSCAHSGGLRAIIKKYAVDQHPILWPDRRVLFNLNRTTDLATSKIHL